MSELCEERADLWFQLFLKAVLNSQGSAADPKTPLAATDCGTVVYYQFSAHALVASLRSFHLQNFHYGPGDMEGECGSFSPTGMAFILLLVLTSCFRPTLFEYSPLSPKNLLPLRRIPSSCMLYSSSQPRIFSISNQMTGAITKLRWSTSPKYSQASATLSLLFPILKRSQAEMPWSHAPCCCFNTRGLSTARGGTTY